MDSYALIAGAVLGAVFVALAYRARRHTKRILVRALIVAALVYVVFAIAAHASVAWIAAEMLGVVLYGGIALRGLRGSAWWIAAGWALHPVWDIALHLFGPGHTLAPDWYTVPCFTWDLVVAAVVAINALRARSRGTQTRGVPHLATR